MKSQSIVKRIMLPMIFVVVATIIMLVGSVLGGGILEKLEQNEKDILYEKVVSRENNIETEMIHNWSNIKLTLDAVNEKAEALFQEGAIQKDSLDDNSEMALPLLNSVTENLISEIRNNQVTGAFLILNTEDLEADMKGGVYQDKPGIYIRDKDPLSPPSINNKDLTVLRAPAEVVKELNIAMDSNWTTQFEFGQGNSPYLPLLYEPYQQAFHHTVDGDVWDYGYWSTPYQLLNDNESYISYSVPLILKDGTVYGVMGVEISLEYLQTLLPYEELMKDGKCAYQIRVESEQGKQAKEVVTSGVTLEQPYSTTEYLQLYNSHTPFVEQKWAVVGQVEKQQLSKFENKLIDTSVIAIILTLGLGVIVSVMVSRMIANPIMSLAEEMDRFDGKAHIRLTKTKIREVDRLVTSIEQLNDTVLESATKFTQILEMSEIRMAVFEVNLITNTLFITKNFFHMFGDTKVNEQEMSIDEFSKTLRSLHEKYCEERDAESSYLYKVSGDEGERYLRLRFQMGEERCIGSVEDVTDTILEKKGIEHERDYDFLTGLLSRRAFTRQMNCLFEQGATVLKTAALMMLDLDDLKVLNDRYGHECGDRYIVAGAVAFSKGVPTDAIVARVSGDEFYIFLYGYKDKQEIQEVLEHLRIEIQDTSIELSISQKKTLGVSGGVAWYPEDSDSFEKLSRYSEFAMYQVKKNQKGKLGDFDLGVYNEERYQQYSKVELSELIHRELVEYHFQPIIDAHTGEIYAYEALMRPKTNALHSPVEVLELAKKEHKLQQIEKLTWYKSMSTYVNHIRSGKINPKCKVFINSIADCVMEDNEIQEFKERNQEYLQNIVLEITEDCKVDMDAIRTKIRWLKAWDAGVALDDYGSGYNSEHALLSIAPHFVKVDIGIVRDIDKDADKQEMVRNLVIYAHQRKICIIAEGVETKEEVEKTIELGVDYLQGYYFAKPTKEPINYIFKDKIPY
ncbi:MAG: EAL domain-containing protein [Lachnospiraceae bacterium]